MTAELAVALPAVVLLLAACLGLWRIGVERIALQDDAALAARVAARDGSAVASPALGAVRPRVTLEHRPGGVVCAVLRATVPPLGVPLTAVSCALGPAS